MEQIATGINYIITTITMNKKFNTTIISLIIITMTACGIEDDDLKGEPTNMPQSESRIIPIKLVGGRIGFDNNGEGNKSTTSHDWSHGDRIYIAFYNESKFTSGEAIYDINDGWQLSCEGDLAIGEKQKCISRFFVNTTFANSYLVSLNENSEIYEDSEATYTYDGDELTVYAQMTPKTGRIRFTGTTNETISLTGLSHYTTFSPSTNSFTSTSSIINTSVDTNKSTPYIYAFISDEKRNIGIIGDDYAFTRTCTEDILKKGESGYMKIPSETSHKNWRNGLYVNANGIEFKMIPVAGHEDIFFLIGETEVTEELYYAINGNSSSSQLPVSNISHSAITDWIQKLNAQTNLFFSLPSSSQWVYAAKGGCQSQGYTYSGSNNPNDVAWYCGNCTQKQPVKTKAPNELGIYDMSGNVSEYTSTRDYNKVSSSSYFFYYYGGSYSSILSYCSVEDYNNSNYSYYPNIGFRLMLTCD